MAANIFTGVTNSNWGTSTNWSLGSVPTSADGNIATLNITSPNCILDTSSRSCNNLDMTGYAATFSGTQALNVFGNCTFGGTITASGGIFPGASGTWTSNGIAWSSSFSITSSVTLTFADPFVCNGSFTYNTGSNGTGTMNGSTFTIKGNFTTTASKIIAGTTTITFGGTSGTSTLSCAGGISNPVVINSTNAISMGAWIQTGGSITYTTASSFTNISATTITGSCTLNLAGITLFNITISANSIVLTLSSLLTVTSINLTHTVTFTLAGTAGFSVGTLSNLNGGDIIYVSGNTYTINTSAIVTGTAAALVAWVSSSSPTKAIVTFSPNCTMDIGFCSPTDIDSSLGRTVLTYKGTISNCNNWKILPVVPATITS